MDLKLDRIAVEEAGANPVRMAEAVHQQLEDSAGPVPVDAIARALDIKEVRIEELDNIEGALVTMPERGYGSILLNKRSSPERRRFTLSHELCHFLNPWHQPTDPHGFWCSRSDMTASDARSADMHWRQESEANAFAIELLTPRSRLQGFLSGEGDLRRVLAISQEFFISRAAATRRYVGLHDEKLAAVFSRNGRMTYAEFGGDFPRLCLSKHGQMPPLPDPIVDEKVSDTDEGEAGDWLVAPEGVELTVQTLHQANGYATTLLRVDAAGPDDDGLDDTYDRFSRL